MISNNNTLLSSSRKISNCRPPVFIDCILHMTILYIVKNTMHYSIMYSTIAFSSPSDLNWQTPPPDSSPHPIVRTEALREPDKPLQIARWLQSLAQRLPSFFQAGGNPHPSCLMRFKRYFPPPRMILLAQPEPLVPMPACPCISSH